MRHESDKLRAFTLKEIDGRTCLVEKQFPWALIQVVATNPSNYDKAVEAAGKKYFVGQHEVRRDFLLIVVGMGDWDGKHPEHHIDDAAKCIDEVKDALAQAVVWYATNIPE